MLRWARTSRTKLNWLAIVAAAISDVCMSLSSLLSTFTHEANADTDDINGERNAPDDQQIDEQNGLDEL